MQEGLFREELRFRAFCLDSLTQNHNSIDLLHGCLEFLAFLEEPENSVFISSAKYYPFCSKVLNEVLAMSRKFSTNDAAIICGKIFVLLLRVKPDRKKPSRVPAPEKS